MAGFESTPNNADEKEPIDTVSQTQIRFGWGLFVIYCLLYGGFVLMNAFAPLSMKSTPLAGVNIAVLYGLGLIVAAFLTALVYEGICYVLSQRASRDRENRQ